MYIACIKALGALKTATALSVIKFGPVNNRLFPFTIISAYSFVPEPEELLTEKNFTHVCLVYFIYIFVTVV